MQFILKWIITSIAVSIATAIVPGIVPFGPVDTWLAFAFVGLFLGFVNALVKPLLTIISLPITLITLGAFQLIINTFMLELANWLSVNLLGAGIAIASFWSAFFGAIVISILSSIMGVVAKE